MTKEVKRFFNLVLNGNVADLDIYGDIVSEAYSWDESDMNVFRLSKRLEQLEGVTQINVNINSYGGEVAEGIAIYNALVRHPAKIVTRCDGMACSIASVIFMAGDERIMYEPSMLMIHNASSMAWGTAADLRKAADDNEKITSMSKAAYLQSVNITEEELTALMDSETWISPAEALNMGFATAIESRIDPTDPSQSVRSSVFEMIAAAKAVPAIARAGDDDDDPDEEDPDDVADGDIEIEDDPKGGDPEEDDTDGDDPEDDPEKDDEEERKDEQALSSFIMAAYK